MNNKQTNVLNELLETRHYAFELDAKLELAAENNLGPLPYALNKRGVYTGRDLLAFLDKEGFYALADDAPAAPTVDHSGDMGAAMADEAEEDRQAGV